MEDLKNFECPICCEVMTDPVQTAAGQSYDRHCIQEFIRVRGGAGRRIKDPVAGTDLGEQPVLTPNFALKGAIHDFLEKNEAIKRRMQDYAKLQENRFVHADLIPEKFLDVLTMSIIKHPVLAEDDHTYDRASIQSWIADLEARGQEVISPVTKLPMGTNLVANDALKRELDAEIQGVVARITAHEPSEAQPVETFPELNMIFNILDDVSDVLHEVLEGWTEPRIVVIGAEKVGKSTLLERLCLLPIFGAQDNEHTRMAMEVRIKRTKAHAPPTIQVWDTSSHQARPMGEPKQIRSQSANDDLLEEVKKTVREACGSGTPSKIIINRELRVTVTSDSLPPMRLLDLPGIVENPPDMATMSRQLVAKYLDSGHASCSIFLAVMPATLAPTNSPALAIIKERSLAASTIGVITKCDRLDPDQDEHNSLRQWLLTPEADSMGVPLEPHGYVGIVNKKRTRQRDGEGSPALPSSTRLLLQAREELAWFKREGFQDLIHNDCKRAGTPALQERLNRIYVQNVRETWESQLRKRLYMELNLSMLMSDQLGQPPAPGNLERGDYGRLMSALKSSVLELIKPLQAALYSTFVETTLTPLHQLVHEALGDNRRQVDLSKVVPELSTVRKEVESKVLALIDANPIRKRWCEDVKKALEDNGLPLRLQRFPRLVASLLSELERIAPLVPDTAKKAVQEYLSVAFDPVKSRDVALAAVQFGKRGSERFATSQVTINKDAIVSTVLLIFNQSLQSIEDNSLQTTISKVIADHPQEAESCLAERAAIARRISHIAFALLKLQPLQAHLCDKNLPEFVVLVLPWQANGAQWKNRSSGAVKEVVLERSQNQSRQGEWVHWASYESFNVLPGGEIFDCSLEVSHPHHNVSPLTLQFRKHTEDITLCVNAHSVVGVLPPQSGSSISITAAGCDDAIAHALQICGMPNVWQRNGRSKEDFCRILLEKLPPEVAAEVRALGLTQLLTPGKAPAVSNESMQGLRSHLVRTMQQSGFNL